MRRKWWLALLAAFISICCLFTACNVTENNGESLSDSGTQSEESIDDSSDNGTDDSTDNGMGDSSTQTPCEHTGGSATCTKRAVCELCEKEYGELAAHEYKLLTYNGTEHWYECVCGAVDESTKQAHEGGSATCEAQAICSVCKQGYGKISDHDYAKVNYNKIRHWYECECGVVDESSKKLHTGGSATCSKQAECSICEQPYGNFANHDYTEYKYTETTFWYECVCGEKGEEQPRMAIKDCVDFVVDVEAGRDIRVLQLTDVQTISCDQKRYADRVSANSAADIFTGYQRYIGQVIERYDPDFIIMTGDNTYGEFDDYGEQHLALIEFMDSFEIPWAPVFGNHDNESNMGVDWQCEQFEKSEYCLFKQRELTGNGNYSVGLTQGGELKRVFYMLDSNGCGNMSAISLANGHSKTTAGFGDDQIEWYSKSMEIVKGSYPDAQLSMAFHIQIAIFEDAFRQYGYSASTIRNNPINLDTLDSAKANGDFGYIGREPKGPWDYGNTVWNTIKKYGVDSVFVGHEHCNSASILYDGVRLTYGQKSSTFDRYNLMKADGTITNTSVTYSGTPIMGGTFIQLSQNDGSIVDAGLYLYDHALGWEKPTVEEEKITIDNIPAGATVTEFDFNGTDFDATVYTDGIKDGRAKQMTDTTSVPAGFTGGVYSQTTNDLTCVGVKFDKEVNADRLMAVFVKMYVSNYSITSGKDPLLRIYNDSVNSILNGQTYTGMGGEYGKWVYVDILDLLKGSSGIIDGGKLAPFSLLYRFYGAEAGTAYFDSITVVSDGDMYAFDEAPEDDGAIETVHGGKYYAYKASDFDGVAGMLGGNKTAFMAIDKSSYSIQFSLTPAAFAGQLWVYGYASESSPTSGIGVCLTSSGVTIKNGKGTVALNAGQTYEIEVGFVALFNGNTVYTFVKVNGTVVAWEFIESYHKTAGNIAIVSKNASDSFTIA